MYKDLVFYADASVDAASAILGALVLWGITYLFLSGFPCKGGRGKRDEK